MIDMNSMQHLSGSEGKLNEKNANENMMKHPSARNSETDEESSSSSLRSVLRRRFSSPFLEAVGLCGLEGFTFLVFSVSSDSEPSVCAPLMCRSSLVLEYNEAALTREGKLMEKSGDSSSV